MRLDKVHLDILTHDLRQVAEEWNDFDRAFTAYADTFAAAVEFATAVVPLVDVARRAEEAKPRGAVGGGP